MGVKYLVIFQSCSARRDVEGAVSDVGTRVSHLRYWPCRGRFTLGCPDYIVIFTILSCRRESIRHTNSSVLFLLLKIFTCQWPDTTATLITKTTKIFLKIRAKFNSKFCHFRLQQQIVVRVRVSRVNILNRAERTLPNHKALWKHQIYQIWYLTDVCSLKDDQGRPRRPRVHFKRSRERKSLWNLSKESKSLLQVAK